MRGPAIKRVIAFGIALTALGVGAASGFVAALVAEVYSMRAKALALNG